MLREVRARVSHGKLEPLEDLGLPEGEEVTILVREPFKKKDDEEARAAFERSAGSWEGLLDFDEFLSDLRESRKRGRPPIDLDL
jgi:hypothetical protein